MPAIFRFTETVIEYDPEDLQRWKDGDKSFLVPDGETVPDIVLNQPNYHFGEYFVYHHFSLAQWNGFVWYGIGTWQLDSPTYLEGRETINRLFPPERLSEIREHIRDDGAGEPDLFFYRDGGDSVFVEVKKQGDRISSEQLRCLALIKGILEADVAVVYLKEKGSAYTPKHYELDLSAFSGRRLS